MPDPLAPTNLTMAVAASALKAQQSRMRVIAENLANADSTAQTPGGDPYRRQVAVFEPQTIPGQPMGAATTKGVAMTRIAADGSQFKSEYAPGNPGADSKGYVKLPNVDPLMEALDMQEAQRAYAANLNVIDTARSMDSATLGILTK